MRDNYKLVGHFYEFMSSDSVNHCRVAMLDYLQPGDTVLFAGVGHGLDAIYAAQRGANVTVVDLSQTMLQKFQQNLEKRNIQITIRQVHGDIMRVTEYEQYDMVVANFFLNIFNREMMAEVLEHLIKLGKPRAKIVVGDFSCHGDNILSHVFQTLSWYGIAAFFWVLAGQPIHDIYNYPEEMKSLGLQVREKKHFKVLLLDCYWSLLGQKPA